MLIRNVNSAYDLEQKRKLQAELLQIAIDNEKELEKRIADYKNPNIPPPVPPQYKSDSELQGDMNKQEKDAIENLLKLGVEYPTASTVAQTMRNRGQLVQLNSKFPFFKKELTDKFNPKLFNASFLNDYFEEAIGELNETYGLKSAGTRSTHVFAPDTTLGDLDYPSQQTLEEMTTYINGFTEPEMAEDGTIQYLIDPIEAQFMTDVLQKMLNALPSEHLIETIMTAEPFIKNKLFKKIDMLFRRYNLPKQSDLIKLYEMSEITEDTSPDEVAKKISYLKNYIGHIKDTDINRMKEFNNEIENVVKQISGEEGKLRNPILTTEYSAKDILPDYPAKPSYHDYELRPFIKASSKSIKPWIGEFPLRPTKEHQTIQTRKSTISKKNAYKDVRAKLTVIRANNKHLREIEKSMIRMQRQLDIDTNYISAMQLREENERIAQLEREYQEVKQVLKELVMNVAYDLEGLEGLGSDSADELQELDDLNQDFQNVKSELNEPSTSLIQDFLNPKQRTREENLRLLGVEPSETFNLSEERATSLENILRKSDIRAKSKAFEKLKPDAKASQEYPILEDIKENLDGYRISALQTDYLLEKYIEKLDGYADPEFYEDDDEKTFNDFIKYNTIDDTVNEATDFIKYLSLPQLNSINPGNLNLAKQLSESLKKFNDLMIAVKNRFIKGTKAVATEDQRYAKYEEWSKAKGDGRSKAFRDAINKNKLYKTKTPISEKFDKKSIITGYVDRPKLKEWYDANPGKFLLSETSEGFGAKSKNGFKANRIKIGKGIETAGIDKPIYATFGKYVLHVPRLLQDNVLSLRYPSLGQIPKLKPKGVSDNYREVIESIVDTQTIDPRLYKKLHDDEKEHFDVVMKGSGLSVKLGYAPIGPKQDDKEDESRLNLLIGEIHGGNNSVRVRKELEELVKKLVVSKKLSKSQGMGILTEL